MSSDKASSFVGGAAYEQRGFLDISHPIERGIITNWSDMEKVWQHMFHQLKVNPEDKTVLLGDSCRNAVKHSAREEMVKYMFEELKVGKFYVIDQALLAIYASGRVNGIAVDSGYGLTQIVPVIEGYVSREGVISTDLAGNDLTLQLADMLSKKGSLGFSPSVIKDDADITKLAACYVALNYDEDLQKLSGSAEETFNLHSGQFLKTVKLGTERIKCTESLFKPYIAGIDSAGIHDKIYHSISKCTADSQKTLYSNIVLSGGTTLLPGFADRLKKELKHLVAPDTTVKIIAPPERANSAWIGGSILASLEHFEKMWILRKEYDEHGPNIVHRKCF